MRIRVYKTNRRIKESPFLTKCAEQDGLLGNIEMNCYTNVDDYFTSNPYYVDPGSNLKRPSEDWSGWLKIAYKLEKPGVFDKLAKYFKK